MDAFEFNKIIGWVLAAVLVVVGGQTFMEIYSSGHGTGNEEQTAYAIQVEESADKAPATEAEEKPLDIKPLLATASIEMGEKVAKKCVSCHTVEEGGKNKVGPALYGILNRDKASHDGFSYSDAMKESGGKWDYDALAAFLKSPKGYIPGTKMAFSGLRKDDQIAGMILYLRSLSNNPAALP